MAGVYRVVGVMKQVKVPGVMVEVGCGGSGMRYSTQSVYVCSSRVSLTGAHLGPKLRVVGLQGGVGRAGLVRGGYRCMGTGAGAGGGIGVWKLLGFGLLSVSLAGVAWLRWTLNYVDEWQPDPKDLPTEEEAPYKEITLPNGRVVSYLEKGSPTGKPLILLHRECSCRLEMDTFKYDTHGDAVDEGVRVIAIDRPGYGRSDMLEEYTISGYAKDVLAVADALELKEFAIAGMGFGGAFALGCAIHIPQMQPGRLRGVAIFSTVGSRHKKDTECIEETPMDQAELGNVPVVGEITFSYGFAAVRTALFDDPHKFYEDVMKPLNSGTDSGASTEPKIILNMKEALRRGREGWVRDAVLLRTLSWDIDVGNVDGDEVPVHIWHGQGDKLAAWGWASYFHERIPGSTLHLVPGVGHFRLPSIVWSDAIRLACLHVRAPESGVDI